MDSENKQQPKPIKALRTYAGDVEEALNKTKSSSATIMLAEEKRREEKPQLSIIRRPQSSERNRLYLVLSSILLFLAISVIGAVYYLKQNEETVILQQSKALINYTKSVDLNVSSSTREQILQKISNERESFGQPANSVLFINTTDVTGEAFPAEELFTRISGKIPADLARSFQDKYMIGVYAFDSNALFMIIKTDDYQIAYSGMLRWEKNMINDVGRIFSVPQNLMGGNVNFIDEEYKNRDLRIVLDSNNKTVLLYTFIDKNTIIITTGEDVLNAILSKYIINQQIR
ncbi:MAG: hypothetical protein WAW92_04105 [Minisyncoccia bacterium]